MTIRSPFKPHYGSGQTVTPAAGSAQATIAEPKDKTIRFANIGAAVCHVRTYNNTEAATQGTATTADLAVPAGAVVIVEKSMEHDRFAHVSATGTTLHVMTGEGGA